MSRWVELRRWVTFIKLSIFVSISDVSFTLLSIFKTPEYKYFSTKIDAFSIVVPHPLVILWQGYLLYSINRTFYLDSRETSQ